MAILATAVRRQTQLTLLRHSIIQTRQLASLRLQTGLVAAYSVQRRRTSAAQEGHLKFGHVGRAGACAAAVVLLLGPVAFVAARAAVPPRPMEFDICQGCHGVYAQGNAELGAPRLAGLAAPYLGRQLADYRDRRRGASEGDVYGAQMVQIASLLDDTVIGRLSAYIGAMPEVETAQTIGGHAEAGAAAYATCAACHGASGEGGTSLDAPRLAGMSDWYLLRQFASFASGRRGTEPGNDRGAAMRTATAAVASDQAVRDVITFAVSLPGPVARANASPGVGVRAATTCTAARAEACVSSR